jgi:hypothetical protein
MRTLDSIATVDKVSGPLLLKLDVQGYELEVLRGAERLLQITEVAIFEASLIQYNEGSPLIDEIIAFMAERGFVVFDFCGQARRETDHALFQTDIAFVRRESPLRARKKFWLGEP